MSALIVAVLALLASISPGTCFEMEMKAQMKCVYEELRANVIVVGEWSAFSRYNRESRSHLDLRVEDRRGEVLHEVFDVTDGRFAFTTKEAGEYKACWRAANFELASQTQIRIQWKTGVAATDWSSIAKKEHLDELMLELRRLEDSIRESYQDLVALQKREQEMRDISEATNAKVAWYSMFSLSVCIGLGVWQIWYLRRFFERKKLI